MSNFHVNFDRSTSFHRVKDKHETEGRTDERQCVMQAPRGRAA